MNNSSGCECNLFQISLASNLLVFCLCAVCFIITLFLSASLRKHKNSTDDINKNLIIFLNEIIIEVFTVMTVVTVSVFFRLFHSYTGFQVVRLN